MLENAIYHGIEPRADGGTIQVRGRRDGDQLLLSIENPVPEHNNNPRHGNRMALENIRLRFEALYVGQGGLSSVLKASSFHVELRFPYQAGIP